MPRARNVFVSLQDRTARGTPAQRHRASGVLIGADLVTVPVLERPLLDEIADYDVLLVCGDDGHRGGRRAERIGIAWVEAHSWQPDFAVATLRLTHRSRLPVARAASASTEQLRDGLLRHDGDFWAVLADRGIAPANRDADPAVVLADLPPIVEMVSGPPPVELFSHEDPGGSGVRMCDLVPWCIKPPPPPPKEEPEPGCCDDAN